MAFRCNDGANSIQSGLCGASEYSFDFEEEYKKSPSKQSKAQRIDDNSALQSTVQPTLYTKDETETAKGQANVYNSPQEEAFMVVVDKEEFENNGEHEIVNKDDTVGNRDEEDPYNYEDMALGSIFCWCMPAPVSSSRDGVLRTFHWLELNKDQLMAGIAVAIGQIPQVTSYALLAGVSPSMALQATWIMNIITSIFGGRPGMVSGTTALSAIALIDLVQNEGVSFVFYAIMLAGIWQMAFGFLRLGRVLRFVPHSAMVGYMNAIAIIAFTALLKYFKVPGEGINEGIGDGRLYQYHFNFFKVLYDGTPWVDLRTVIVMSVEAAIAFFVCIAFPRISTAIPSPVLAFALVTALEWTVARYIGIPSTLIGDYVSLETPSFPTPIILDARYTLPPINYDTWRKVWPSGLSLFVATLAESLLTYRVSSEKVNTRGSSSRMAFGQGLAQVISAFLGGMGGGGALDQTIINYKAGGETGLSVFSAGLVLFTIVAGAYPAVAIVPLSAAVGVMLYSAFNIFQWDAFMTLFAAIFPRTLRDVFFLDCKVNRIDSCIMLVVMVFTIFVDTAIAACLGATIAVYAYAWDTSNHLEVDRVMSEGDDTVTYRIKGPIFFSTYPLLLSLFTQEVIGDDPKDVILFLKDAEILDWSGQFALKTLYLRIESCGKSVALSSLSESSRNKMEKNSSLWYGCVFLEMEEVEEEDLRGLKKDKSNGEDEITLS